MPRVVTVGETMLRLSPVDVSVIEEADKLYAHVAGAESNVAVALARMGIESGWVSKLVRNPSGNMIANRIRQHNVDVSKVVWSEEGRNGLFYVEFGSEPRPTKVVYDRSHSAFTSLVGDEINWNYLLGSELIHLTGITPALGEKSEKLVLEIIKKAREKGCTLSFDVNYRNKLWAAEAAKEVLSKIIHGLNILICSVNDAKLVFGYADLSPEEMAKEFYKAYKNEIVVITLGENGALAYDGENTYKQDAFKTDIVDRIGRGDAFTAGFLYGYLTGSVRGGIRYGNAMASLKQTTKGDFFWCDKETVDALVQGKYKKLDR
jgi:2-dehydro-3-deoxygluconokinase